jgi:hypothetical protein
MKTKPLLMVAALVALLAALVVMMRPLLSDASIWPPDDYVEYWAAGRLNLEGKNPYSPAELLPLERFAGRDTDEAIMMWNPPWTLSLAMPLGALPAREGQFVWLLLQAGSIIAAAALLWKCFGGNADKAWIAVAVSLGFVPTLFLFQSGQISGFLVLGAALFIWGTQRGYDFLAGAAAVLLAVKPHLAYLLWLAIALHAVSHRRYRIILGGVVVGAIATAIPMLFNPQVWTHYVAAYRDHPPAQWVSLTIGSVLRLALGEEKFWLQFVPVLAGVGWFAAVWKKHWRSWNWAERTPAIILVSFVTAPYGAWHFDLVILLVPMLYRVRSLIESGGTASPCPGRGTQSPRLGKIAYLALFIIANLTMIVLNRLGVYSYWFGWVAPLVLIFYFATAKREHSSQLAPVTA